MVEQLYFMIVNWQISILFLVTWTYFLFIFHEVKERQQYIYGKGGHEMLSQWV